ncbi:MAG: molybdopterin-dependent oxidoreductase [Coriobacteriia bacterium]|nr:molybdopterin-dependent oxidoreductase [Coriobacteriia bacterium]
MGKIFGRGAMTNHWNDLENSDVIVTCGVNNAENHPLSIKHIDMARVNHGATYIVVDPRFTRSAAVADIYAPLRSGTNTVFFGALINYVIQNKLYQEDYIINWTTAPFLVNPDFKFEDGLFSGYDPENHKYDKSTWTYDFENEGEEGPAALRQQAAATGSRPETATADLEAAEQAAEKTQQEVPAAFKYTLEPGVPEFTIPVHKKAKMDETLQDPQCVFQLMAKQYERYTPEMVENICGMPQEQFLQIAEIVGSTGAPDKVATFLYAMGLTQHTTGSQMIKCLAMLQLLLGNIGMCGGGVNAFRGESNVQGSTDFGLLFDQLPGYCTLPTAGKQNTLRQYLETTTASAGYYTNRPKFVISLLKEMYGEHATLENDFCYDYLPKLDGKDHSYITIFEHLYNGEEDIRMLIAGGQNPIVGLPNVNMVNEALKKLEMIVVADLWETETSVFWKRPGNDPASIQTEVFLLPMASSYEKQGSVTNSGRMAQWRYKAVEPLGNAIDDVELYTGLYEAVKKAYEREPGKFDDPIMKLSWPYYNGQGHPDSRLVAQGINGYTVEDGKLLAGFGSLKADGSTACGCWIYSGYYNNNDAKDDPTQQPTGRQIAEDVSEGGGQGGLNQYVNWSWVWPLNRRIIYNRASMDKHGNPYNPKFPLISWDKANKKWLRNDVPDFGFTNPDGSHMEPEKTVAFMMNEENRAAFFTAGMADGVFPEHYEPVESPVANMLSSQQNSPLTIIYRDDQLGGPDEYPIICTTYRMSEHWQAGAMTRNLPWLAECQPKVFVEMSETLAESLGISNGDDVEVYNKRGSIVIPAMITKRMKAYNLGDGPHEVVGVPWNWGFASMCAQGESANELTPTYLDPSSKIPEFKAFLVNVRKAVN